MTPPVSSIQAAVLRAFAQVASRGNALLILTYHRVVPTRDELLPDEPDAAGFSALVDAMRSTFNVLPLGEAMALRQAGKLPPRTICITFDDGYANNAEVALPILAARGLRATFFVATGYLNGGRMWNDTVIEAVRHAPEAFDVTDLGLGSYVLSGWAQRRAALGKILSGIKYREPQDRLQLAGQLAERAGVAGPSNLMMSDAQVRELATAGMEVGAHTITHPILTRIDPKTAMDEITGSRERLKQIIGAPVDTFAYPNGRPGTDYAGEHVGMVRKAGFSCAVSTAWGCATPDADLFQLPRIAPWGPTPSRYLLRMVRSYLDRTPKVA